MVQGEMLDVGGVAVDPQRLGTGEPVLFLLGVQGLGVPPGSLPPFLDAWAERFDVLAPSHPGFGRSQRPSWFDCTADLADHYGDLLDALGLKSVRLVGHSFGAWVAAEWAARAPWRIDRLVLANPLGVWLPGVSESTPNIFMYSPQEVVEISYADAARGADVIPTDMAQSEQWFADWSSLSLYGWSPYLHDPKLIHRLHRITAPTLIIGGERDRIVPVAHVEAFHQRIRGSQLTVVPGAGHALPIERAKEFGAMALEFLAQPAAHKTGRESARR
jgi:pimeloyl-ACP methyl ester carboxylesterase